MLQIEKLGSLSEKNRKLLNNALDEAVVVLNNNRECDEEGQTSKRSGVSNVLSPSKLPRRPGRNLKLSDIAPEFDANLEVEKLSDSHAT